ncbi:MAG: competence/damage-inducible protein A [Clostridiales bacterium]|nr:competence/damage-inducible protein A [Clostridiales bacterium]
MNGEIICVGTELLLGDIVNTNAQYLSRELAAMGISVFGQSTVGDNAARLKKVLGMAVARSQIVIITGGLGPTKDDLTKETVAQAVGLPLEEDAESLRRIEAYFRRVGRPMGETNRKQALKPHGAVVFPNDRGTAPGYAISAGEQCIILLPGPPDELRPMFETYVKPYLAQYETGTIVSHTLRVFGLGESAAAERLADLLDGANPTVAPYAKTGEVELRVTASAADRQTADEMCRPVMEEIRRRLDGCIYGVDKDSLQQVVVEGLRQKGIKAATAESCTAGLLSKRLTEEPGSSSVFEMGITAYADSVKINALGVDPALIEQYGAVSAQTAAAMAGGIREISGAHVGLSITGVAGPEPSEGKPVGLVYIALADEKQVYVRRLMAGRAEGEREKIRSMAASAALDLLRRWLENPDMPGSAPYVEPEAVNGGRGAALAAAGILAAGEAVVLDALPGSALPPVEARPVSHAEQIMNEIRQNLNQEEYGEEPSAEELFSSAGADDPAAKLAAREPETSGLEENTILYVSDYEEDYHPGQKAGIEKKLPWYSRMRRYLFPCKGDSAGEVIRKIIFLVAAVCLIGSGVYLGVYFYTGHQQLQSQGETRKLYDPANNDIGADGIYKKFYPLLEQNSDTIGWMSIPNANVDNPVVKTPEDYDTLEPFYLKHAFDKTSSRYGALFVDRYTNVTFQRQSQNIVVYGHHMRDGSMFGSVKKYRQLDFYKENPIIEFDTLYRKGTYKIFSVFIVNTIPESDNGFVFEYRYSDFDNQEDFMQMVEQMQIRSIINAPVDVLPGDELLTLSTCTYEFDDARLVVVARKVREGESASVDVGAATLNPKPLYPQIWYDKKGGTRPDVTSIHQKTYSSPSITARPASSDPSGASQGTSTSRPSTNSQPAATSRPKVPTDTPTSVPPATDPPVTKPPVSEPEPPVTAPPVTEPPTTEPDTPTEPPVTDPPATDPPVTDPPAVDPPDQGGGDEPAE